MPLVLVPIPIDALEGSSTYWRPYILLIAERSGNEVLEMERMLYAGEAQAFLVWDSEAEKTKAFLGARYARNQKGRLAELIWLVGEDRKTWVHLFDELKLYLKEHQKCVAVRPICRPGWKKLLEPMGFKITHYVMELAL